MMFGFSGLETLMMQLTCLAAAFLGGGWVVHCCRARRPKMGATPAAGQADPAPSPSQAQAPSGSPARQCGNGQILSHEMRNYLCAIRGNAHLLRQKARTPEQAAILDRIEQALERLEGFAARDPALPDAMASRLREWIDTVQAARCCCRTPLEAGRAEFSFNASEGLPYIQGDPHRLEQVFMNLYGNALEAGADRVRTQFRRIGNELEISVEDNGRGCRQELVPRLFDPFFSTKSVVGGMGGESDGIAAPGPVGRPVRGLGLFIVRSIVENHGGRIRASSKNGRGFGETGLVVYMHFPVPQEDPAPPEDRQVRDRTDQDSALPERRPIAAGT